MTNLESTPRPAPDRSERFGRLEDSGPVRGYLDGLSRRSATAMDDLLGGTPHEQAAAKERLAVCTAEYLLAVRFDEQYFDRAGFVGHTQAIEQVSSELEAALVHGAIRGGDGLLDALGSIRAAYDREGRQSNAGAISTSPD